jgi:carboxymethylenebutenolidase
MTDTAHPHEQVVLRSIDIPAGEGTADVYYAHPERGGPHPAVLLHMDAYGLRAALEAHVRRLAGMGYCVLAPNVFYRDGRSPVVENIEQAIAGEDRSALFASLRPRMQRLTPAAQDADSVAWLAFLRSRSEVAQGAIGAVGYCMGGRLTLRMAGEFPADVAAAASFHGGNLATDQPDSPHLSAVNARAELYIGHADNDGSMPPEQMALLTRELAAAHVRHTAELYSGAGHGWTQTDAPVYDRESADRHWLRLGDLFGRVLAGQRP